MFIESTTECIIGTTLQNGALWVCTYALYVHRNTTACITGSMLMNGALWVMHLQFVRQIPQGWLDQILSQKSMFSLLIIDYQMCTIHNSHEQWVMHCQYHACEMYLETFTNTTYKKLQRKQNKKV